MSRSIRGLVIGSAMALIMTSSLIPAEAGWRRACRWNGGYAAHHTYYSSGYSAGYYFQPGTVGAPVSGGTGAVVESNSGRVRYQSGYQAPVVNPVPAAPVAPVYQPVPAYSVPAYNVYDNQRPGAYWDGSYPYGRSDNDLDAARKIRDGRVQH